MIHPASPILALTAAAALSAPLPRLESLTVSVTEGGGGGAARRAWGAAEPPKRLRPDFDPETFHYAVRCDDPETLSVSGAAAGSTATVTLNGAPVPRRFEEREVVLRHDQDLAIVVSDGGDSATYAVHCVGLDFPRVWTVGREPGRRDGLLLVDPIYMWEGGEEVSHIAILDDNGVPRFHRRVPGWVFNFRWHAAHRMYSYNRQVRSDPPFSEVVLLDERLDPVARPEPVGLHHPDQHDFLLTDEGNYLFVVFEPVERDLSPYPDRDAEFPFSTAELTVDYVIQEVSPDGEVLFQWNSWGKEDGAPAIRVADCVWTNRRPRAWGWAHLNSLFLADGDIVASFRGCSQVLKIERPSGRVLWQLGGSPPAVPDGRIHYTIVGDPEPEGFCGQHTAIESPPGVVTLFDNRVLCLADPPGWWESPAASRRGARVVQYRLDGDEAIFLREYRGLHGSTTAGAVQLLERGRWLITWGNGRNRPDTGAVEVDDAGRVVFAVALRGRYRAHLYRAYREYGLRVPLNLP